MDISVVGDNKVLLFGRVKNNVFDQALLVDEVEPSILVLIKNEELLRILPRLRVKPIRYFPIKKKLFGVEKDFVKLIFNSFKELKIVKEDIEALNIPYFESDLKKSRKYLLDKRIVPQSHCNVEVEEMSDEDVSKLIKESGKVGVPTFRIKSITQDVEDFFDEPRILGFDIETYSGSIDMDKNPIIMISVFGDNIQKVITWLEKKGDEPDFVEFVSDEAELIKRFMFIIKDYKPDVIVGYASDTYDLPYIKRRAEVNNIKLELGLDNSELKIRKGLTTTARIRGIVHVDLFKVVRNLMSYTLKTDTYNLNSVAEELLNDKKEDVNISELTEEEALNGNLKRFYYYNLKDSKLVFQLLKKLLPTLNEIVRITRVPLFEVSRIGYSQIVESFLINKALESNRVIPNKPRSEEIIKRGSSSYEGAFVFEPEPGIYEEILVFDFKSLYPTIIGSHNISPDTLNCGCCKDDERARVPGLDYWFCRKKQGFISSVIEELITRRARVKEALKKIRSEGSDNPILQARQYVLKTIANAMYGYLGFFGSRWYCLECAESVTAYGRYYIQKVIKKAEENGFKVIYSDTDSIFLSLKGEGEGIKNKTREEAMEFVKEINKELPGLMKLEFEGYYERGLFVATKTSKYGAKKKYALLRPNGTLKITGFEFVRRNYCELAKEVQEKTLSIILRENKKEEAIKYIEGVINDLRERKIENEKLIIKTQLQKPTESYASEGPHVILAKKMKEKGMIVKPGMIIQYIVKPGSGRIGDRVELPSECKQGDYDPEYYIKNQIIPVIEKIIELIGYSKEELLKDKKQKGLSDFF